MFLKLKFKNMKKILGFFLLNFLFYSNCLSQTGWFSVVSGTTNYLTSIFFVNNQTGWFSGTDGLIKKTTDGGYTWIPQTVPTTNNLWTLFFFNANTGWAGGGYYDINSFGMNIIIKTTNGGENWFTQINDTVFANYFTQSIYFPNSNTGYAGNEGSSGFSITGIIKKTTNGGLNWTTLGGSSPSKKIIFKNDNTAWSISNYWDDVGGSKGRIYKTTNGGINWIESLLINLWNFHDIFFINTNTGITTGMERLTYVSRYFKTTDAGNNWFEIYSGTNYASHLHFVNEFTGWVCGSNISKTTDGGYNWLNQTPGQSYSLNGITFSDSLNGWCVGSGGKILKTTTGGTTFIRKVENTVTDFKLFQNYPNPFNPSTIIRFSIPENKTLKIGNGITTLKVYNTLGKEVATLVNEKLQPGTYEVKFDGSKLPSGIYFYRFESNSLNDRKKMVLLK
jgi:photosystem II stability/assembly factor-like uncharacterized protein